MALADMLNQIATGTLKNICVENVLFSVMLKTPFVNQGSSGSAVMMGKTANNTVAPKKLMAPASKLPVYFIFLLVTL